VAITIGIPRETFPGERRVAMTPRVMESLATTGVSFAIERGAGAAAGFPDSEYEEKGARLVDERSGAFDSDLVLQVRTAGANPERGAGDLSLLRPGQTVVGFAEPLSAARECAEAAVRGPALFALELIPRITRAQSMDALSSMATIAGYKAALMAADLLPRMFPMLMTAAGTVAPARVFVLGAGVAGLQAIATARRLGAVVSAYDVRPAVKEQIESVGARFVTMPVAAESAEDRGGYARAMGEDFYRAQREFLASVVRENDVVITTAAVPGKRAPVLITAEMVGAMAPGSVIVDVAAERGGNCEVTQPGETIIHSGVTVVGALNLPSLVPYHASQMLARNIAAFVRHLAGKNGSLVIDPADEIVRETLVGYQGEIVHPRVREALGLAEAAVSHNGKGAIPRAH
jgi:NAD(P) transhydrogenase subunit alpha